jgi:hypothetical protein
MHEGTVGHEGLRERVGENSEAIQGIEGQLTGIQDGNEQILQELREPRRGGRR